MNEGAASATPAIMSQERQRKRERAPRRAEEEGGGGERTYTFALVPKFGCEGFPFFAAAYKGCRQRAEELGNVRCECIEASAFDPEVEGRQELIIANLTAGGMYDGMGISVKKAEDVVGAISDAVDAGIPVVTFDSDSPDSRRSAYIGTDNFAMGRELGKVLKQLRPRGGGFVLVSNTGANILERQRGVRESLADTRWYEVGDVSPLMGSKNGTLAVERMWELAKNRPDIAAFLPLYGTPMNKGTQWKEFAMENRDHIAVVSTDWSDLQMDLLSQGYADGLVGQIPYEMGQEVVSNLHRLQDDSVKIQSEILGTNLIEILRVPLVLPRLEVDYNYLGNLTILGYMMFTIVAVLAIGCAIWTFVNRNARVVKASQPTFLFLLCLGVLILGSTIIPLGIDDENHSLRGCNIACMSVPWLFSVGFVLIFSVLFSKTWRVNRLFHNPNKFRRIKVTLGDVILPLILLMTANVIVLACWTALSPLVYVRADGIATDLWNRPTTSTGICKSMSGRKGEALPYVILIFVINIGVLAMANVQAYIARDIKTEFSESKYIALVLASILQACVIGIPIVILARDDPRVSYILNIVLLFVLSVVVLLLMFVPKYIHHKEWVKKKAAKKKKKREETDASVSPLDDTNFSDASDGSDGLKVMMKQSVYVKPGVKVSVVRNSNQATELQLNLEEYYERTLAEEDWQTNGGRPSEEERQVSPEEEKEKTAVEQARHVAFEENETTFSQDEQ